MAENDQAQGKPAEAAAGANADEQKPAGKPERHGVAGWKERARSRFQVSPHAIPGAFALHDDPSAELTENQVRSLIDKYLKLEDASA